MMRKKFKLLIYLFISLLVFSCVKEDTKPGQYELTDKPKDSSNWQSDYKDNGTLPDWNDNNKNNILSGTNWVITKIIIGFATSYPNDTVSFINNTEYIVNNNKNVVRPYNITTNNLSTNRTLSLYFFYPFGGSHYSGELGFYFVEDGIINSAEFINLQNSTSKIKSWWIKIK